MISDNKNQMTLTNPEAGKILESLEKFNLVKTTETFKDECDSLNLNPQGWFQKINTFFLMFRYKIKKDALYNIIK